MSSNPHLSGLSQSPDRFMNTRMQCLSSALQSNQTICLSDSADSTEDYLCQCQEDRSLHTYPTVCPSAEGRVLVLGQEEAEQPATGPPLRAAQPRPAPRHCIHRPNGEQEAVNVLIRCFRQNFSSDKSCSS